jgi:hypothetical protein
VGPRPPGVRVGSTCSSCVHGPSTYGWWVASVLARTLCAGRQQTGARKHTLWIPTGASVCISVCSLLIDEDDRLWPGLA